MKYLNIYLDGNQIELHNSLFGMESVRCNGKTMSRKFSFLGTEHTFTEGDHTYKIRTTTGLMGLYMDLYRDQQAIIETNKNGCFIILMLTIGMLLVLDYFYKFMNT